MHSDLRFPGAVRLVILTWAESCVVGDSPTQHMYWTFNWSSRSPDQWAATNQPTTRQVQLIHGYNIAAKNGRKHNFRTPTDFFLGRTRIEKEMKSFYHGLNSDISTLRSRPWKVNIYEVDWTLADIKTALFLLWDIPLLDYLIHWQHGGHLISKLRHELKFG